MNSDRSNNLSLKYQRFTPLGCKDIGISEKRNNQSWPLCNLFKKKHGLLLQTRQKEKIQVFPTSSKWVIPIFLQPEAKYIEFEPRLKFKTRLKYGWFNLKLYSIFQDLSRGAQLKPVLVRFKPRFKIIKFGHWSFKHNDIILSTAIGVVISKKKRSFNEGFILNVVNNCF